MSYWVCIVNNYVDELADVSELLMSKMSMS